MGMIESLNENMWLVISANFTYHLIEFGIYLTFSLLLYLFDLKFS